MPAAIHPQANLGFAGKYLNELSPGDISQKIFRGQETYESNLWSKLRIFFSIDQTLAELSRFYPYLGSINKTRKLFEEDRAKSYQSAMIATGSSWFVLFQLARRGKVFPILTQFGKFFKTHRVFRHYVWSAALSFSFYALPVHLDYLNITERFWEVHCERMRQKLTKDPANSVYPDNLQPRNLAGAWITPFMDGYFQSIKRANETLITLAPAFKESEYENTEVEAEEVAEGEESAEAEAEEE